MNKKLLLTLLSSLSILSVVPSMSVRGMETTNNNSSSGINTPKKNSLRRLRMLQGTQQLQPQDTRQLQIQEQKKAIISTKLDKLLDILKNIKPFFEIEVQQGQNVYIIGDIHGNMRSCDAIGKFINQHHNDIFVFLGDYVDRGTDGIYVFMKLADLKIQNPNRIHLLRGNHEILDANGYEFYNELKEKFPNLYHNLHSNFYSVFDELPIASVINCGTKKIFCVHGGICPLKGSEILSVERLRNLKSKDGPLATSMLWSDPKDIESDFDINVGRNIGYVFGESATKKFLNENNLDCIVRAHEFTKEGYKENFGGLVKTVFSSLDYCGHNNTAVILEFNSDGTFKQTLDISSM